MLGVFESSLRHGEVVTAIHVPRLSHVARWGYYKVCRKTGEFAHAIGAFVRDPARSVCRAVIGATGARPIVLTDAEGLFTAYHRRGCRYQSGIGAQDHGCARLDRPHRPAGASRCPAPGDRASRRIMKMLALKINGRTVNAEVEPRTHLADFVREAQNLTGTHLGCEHGVCGACTILVDGVPVRSCITYAVACARRERDHHRGAGRR